VEKLAEAEFAISLVCEERRLNNGSVFVGGAV